jgi:hypothetical protein
MNEGVKANENPFLGSPLDEKMKVLTGKKIAPRWSQGAWNIL